MATRSRSNFSGFLSPDYRGSPSTKQQQLHLHTPSTAEGVRISPDEHRPALSRAVTSPPPSPRARASTTSAYDPRMLHDSGAVTPPRTPITASHSKTNSASSAISTLDLKRHDSVISNKSPSRPRGSSSERPRKPEASELKIFPHHLADYHIPDRKKPLGSGIWSDVYLAHACPVQPPASPEGPTQPGADMTPPVTPVIHPVRSRTSSLSASDPSTTYAIKHPATRSAHKVLAQEAKILSHLHAVPDAPKHIIPFHGLDTRTGALVLKAMDMTLESWIQTDLDTLPEEARSARLAAVFPRLALGLLDGLEWMGANAVTHADIKPSNILLARPRPSSSSPSSIAVPEAVYTDFSSALLATTTSTADSPPSPPTPLGGGTWDFLDPRLVSQKPSGSSSPTPSPTSDLWALALTLLYAVLGASPFDAAAGTNQFRKREFVKHGDPLGCLSCGDPGPRNLARLAGLGAGLGAWDTTAWFARVLTPDVNARAGLAEWRDELLHAVARAP